MKDGKDNFRDDNLCNSKNGDHMNIFKRIYVFSRCCLNCAKQVIRTPVKTILFILLTVFSAALLTIGISMYISGEEEIKKADKNFVAEVTIENKHMLTKADLKKQTISLDEMELIKNSPYVKRFSIQRNLVGYAENFIPYHGYMYMTTYDTYPSSVFDITIISEVSKEDFIKVFQRYYDENINVKTYEAKLNNVLSGEEDLETIFIKTYEWNFFDEYDKIFEIGKRYIVNASYGEKRITNSNWKLGETKNQKSNALAYYNVRPLFKSTKDNSKAEYFAALEINEENYSDNPNAQVYMDIAEAYTVNSKEFDIAYVASTNDIKSFYKKELNIEKGRDITDEEYENASMVCLVSRYMMEKNKLEIGDKISFKYRGNNNVPIGFAKSFYSMNDVEDNTFYDDVQTYEIVGAYYGRNLYASEDDTYSIDQNVVVAPISTFPIKNSKEVFFSDDAASRDLTIILEDCSSKNDFLLDLKAEGFNFSKYDVIVNTEGAEGIINTFDEMRKTSLILIICCSLTVLIIEFFIVFMFIGRKKTDIAISLALGSNKFNIKTGYLITILAIVLIGSLLGAFAGAEISKSVINEAYINVKNELMTVGQMFSTAYSTAYAKNFNKTAQIPNTVPAAAIAFCLVSIIIIGIVYINSSIRKETIILLSAKEK